MIPLNSPRQAFTLSKKILLTLSLTALLVNPIWAADGAIQNIRFDAGNRTFVIDSTGPVKASVNTLTIGGRKRIIIDIDNAEIGFELPRDAVLLKDLSDQGAGVTNLSVNQFRGGRPVVRILMDVSTDVDSAKLLRGEGNQIQIQLGQPVIARTPQSSGGGELRPLYSYSAQTEPKPATVNQGPALEEMKKTLVVMNERYERLAQENQDLLVQLRSLERAKSDLGPLSSENENLKSQIRDLESQLARVRQTSTTTSSSTTAELDRYRQKAASLENQLSSLQREVDRLKQQGTNQSGTSEARIAEMRSQLQMAQESLNQSIAKINEQNREIVQLRNQVTEVQRGFDASAKQQITLLQNSLDEKDAQIRDLQSQIVSKSSIPNNTAQLESLKKQLATVTAQYKNTVQELNQQKQKADQEIASLRTRSQRATTLETELAALRNKSQQVETLEAENATLRAKNQRIGALESEVASLTEKLQEANRKATEASASNSTTNNSVELARLKQDNAALKSEVGELHTQLTSLQSERASLKKTVETLKAQKSAPKTTTASKSGDSALKLANEKLENENRILKETLDALQANGGGNAQALRNEMEELKQSLAEANARYEDALKTANEARQELATARAKSTGKAVASGKGDNTALQKQLDALKQQYQTAQNEIQSLKAAATSRTSTMLASATPANAGEAERHYQNGKANLNAGSRVKALEELALAAQMDPRNSQYILEYSSALAEDKQYNEAIQTLRGYLGKNPYDRDAYNQLGKIYLLNDQTEDARQAFSRALPVSTLNNYATTLKKLDRMQEAEEIFKLALKLNPQDSEVLFNLGNLYNATNKLEQAKTSYLEALKLRPDFAEAHYNLGLIYSKLGNKTEAISHLQKFLDLSPNARNAETIRNYLAKLKASA